MPPGLCPALTFSGSNENGNKKWKTSGTIVDADPGRLLSFRIKAKGFKVAEWRYAFETTATGCRVTETWIDQRGFIAKTLGKPVSGVADRVEHNRSTMEQTLERLKQAAESAPSDRRRSPLGVPESVSLPASALQDGTRQMRTVSNCSAQLAANDEVSVPCRQTGFRTCPGLISASGSNGAYEFTRTPLPVD